MSHRIYVFLLLPLFVLTASGCNLLYRMDIQQGNEITQEMVSKLKPGMTRSQVRFVLGSALIEDPFRPNRWDYYYSWQHGVTGEAQRRHLVVYFDGDKLARIEGDVVPKQMKAERDLRENMPKVLIPTPFNAEPESKPATPAPGEFKTPAAPSAPPATSESPQHPL